jgi:hypothetical protein
MTRSRTRSEFDPSRVEMALDAQVGAEDARLAQRAAHLDGVELLASLVHAPLLDRVHVGGAQVGEAVVQPEPFALVLARGPN